MFFFSPVPDYIQKAVETILDIHKNEQPGDILVFLAGQDEACCFVTFIDSLAVQWFM